MFLRKLSGGLLAAAAAYIAYGRYRSMAHEVKSGNSWAGVFSDIEYLIPGIGALLALAGGVLALMGQSGRIVGTVGAVLVLAFGGLIFAMSGMFEMASPILLPGLVMLLGVIGLFVLKQQ